VSGNTTGELAAGATQNITVRYLADTLGIHEADITIAYTYDGIAHSQELPLIGETLALPLTKLWLDDELLAQGDAESMILSIDHPYAADNGTYGDHTATYKIEPGATYVIISGFGAKTPERYLEKRQRILDTYRDSGLADSSREVFAETLYVMGQTWMEETTRSNNLLAQLADVITVSHHRFGVMAQESGYSVAVKSQGLTLNPRQLNFENAETLAKTLAYLMDAMQSGVLEQLQEERPVVSTIKLLSIANSAGQKIFLANSGNFANIEPQLTGYSLEDIENFRSYVADSTIFILPANGQLNLIDWQGKGYISYQDKGEEKSIGMIVGDGFNAGYGAIMDISPIVGDVVNDYYPELKPAADTVAHPESPDPVDMTTGAFLYDRTDISLGGDEPNGLNFARSYNSSNHRQLSTMGYGWRHNYDMFATVHSDASAGLGQRSPVDGAALLVASFSCLDLLRGEPDIKDWVTSSLISNWAMDQLTHNSVSIHFNAKALSYILLPDGTYNPPPGVTTELIQENGLFQLKERFGSRVFFDSSNKVASWQDVDNNTMAFGYNGDRLATVKDSFNRTLTFNYAGDLLASVADSTGRTVAYVYDGANNLSSHTDLAGKVWGYGYDSSHHLTTLVNPLQITTADNSYDGLGRVSTQTVPRQGGATATYNFFFAGTRNLEQDPEGYETIYFHDDKGREVARENQLGHTGRQIFDGRDHVVESINPRQLSTIFEYDSHNNLITTTDALDHLSVNHYDGQHRLTETTDPLNHKVNYGYDTEHHPVSTTVYPAGGESITTATTYYDNGQVHTTTDGRSFVTTATYDANGHPQTSRLDTEPEVGFSYDAVGRMTSLTDQNGNTTSFTYDDRGLITSSTDPFNRITSYSYYDDGKLHTVTDRNNQATTTTYTVSGKVDTVSYHDGGSVSFTYDQHDRLSTMTDSLGTTSYSHDAAGRLLSSTDPHGFTVGYRYDENGYTGLLTTIIYPGNKQVTYTYDSLNRLETVSNWQNQTATYSYDAAGRVVGLINFNGTRTNYGHDDANRLTTIENKSAAGATISSQNFTLDGNGNRTGEERIGPVQSAVGLASLAATYEKNRLRTAGPLNYTQDNEGQRATRSDNTTYTFNARHRLVDIVEGTDSSSYLYDGSANRLQAERDGIITRYIYDSNGNLLAEADQNNAISRYYIHGLGLLAMEIPEIPAGKTYCYHFDALGNTVALTDPAQQVVNHYAYSPFGILLNNQETVPQPFKYVGKLGVMAEANGLYYMRARYYDPEVGRFIAEDPLGFEGGGVNLYVYGGNNPVLMVDPEGLSGFAIDFGGGYGTGWGDNYFDGGSAGSGFFIGTRPDDTYVQTGAFSYLSRPETMPGARIGLGATLTWYNIDARTFFQGDMGYTSLNLFGVSGIRHFDLFTGKTTGYSISLFGKGIGLTGFEHGIGKSCSGFLQQ
jgi:RHS repeat-associated protein